MHKKAIAILGLLLIGGLHSCKKDASNQTIGSTEITFTKEGELSLYKNDGTFIRKIDIEFAEDDYERETGLMHRSSLKDSQGMLFIFDQEEERGFYMKNTLIELDIIYLNKDGVIVSFAENAKPEDVTTLPSQVPAQYVLEIKGGLSEDWVLEIGDRIEWERS